MGEEVEEPIQGPPSRGRHIRKRALRNKALSISFDEKDLRDYVTGFHKRKKKRRKEALKQQGEAERRKRIDLRKKRKQERDYVIYGGAAPPASDGTEENQGDIEEDEDGEPVASISGTTTYDNGDFKVTVTTSEISRVEEIVPSVRIEVPTTTKESIGAQTKHNVPTAKKKPFKRVAKQKSRPKSKNGRDKKNGKKKNNKRR
ncbi:hypothetical protein UlMin_011765 [Ulmus minor]